MNNEMLTRKMNQVLKQHGLPGESMGQMLSRLYQDNSMTGVAVSVGIIRLTVRRWFRQFGVVERSVKFKRVIGPEERQRTKIQKIINRLGHDPTDEIIDLRKQGKTIREVCQEKDLSRGDLQSLGINCIKGFYLYQEAREKGLIDHLSERHQQIFEMHFDQNKSITDIANELGVSRQTLYDSINRAFKKISTLLDRLRQQDDRSENDQLAFLKKLYPLTLGTRVSNALQRSGINTLEDLRKKFAEIHLIRGISRKGTEACARLLRRSFPDEIFINPLLLRLSGFNIALESVNQPLPQIDMVSFKRWQ